MGIDDWEEEVFIYLCRGVAEFDWLTFFYGNRLTLIESTLVQSNVRVTPIRIAIYIPGRGALSHRDFPRETLTWCETSL